MPSTARLELVHTACSDTSRTDPSDVFSSWALNDAESPVMSLVGPWMVSLKAGGGGTAGLGDAGGALQADPTSRTGIKRSRRMVRESRRFGMMSPA
jgi:hypothetical protein